MKIFFSYLIFIILGELDDKMKWLKNFERLLEIQRNVVWPSVMELEPKQACYTCKTRSSH
jgi:hypothetical protein